MNSGGHLHEYEFSSLVQVPPFLQGDESQGFGLGSKSKKYVVLIDYLSVFWLL